MMKIATIAALIGSASAFAPANVGKVRFYFDQYIFFFCLNFLLFLCVRNWRDADGTEIMNSAV